jgi:hypothetical protein
MVVRVTLIPGLPVQRYAKGGEKANEAFRARQVASATPSSPPPAVTWAQLLVCSKQSRWMRGIAEGTCHVTKS